MKKIAYQTPDVKVKALYMDQLMAGSGITGTGDAEIGWGGSDNNPENPIDPASKSDLTIKSVWDD